MTKLAAQNFNELVEEFSAAELRTMEELLAAKRARIHKIAKATPSWRLRDQRPSPCTVVRPEPPEPSPAAKRARRGLSGGERVGLRCTLLQPKSPSLRAHYDALIAAAQAGGAGYAEAVVTANGFMEGWC